MSSPSDERINGLESKVEELTSLLKQLLAEKEVKQSGFQETPSTPLSQNPNDYTRIFAQESQRDTVSRRNTMFGMKDTDVDENKVLFTNNRSIVVQENVILEKDKLHLSKDGKLNEMDVLEIKTTYLMNKNNKLDNTKSFVHYLGKDVLESLLSNERILNTEYGKVLTMLNIFDTPDEAIMTMIGRKVRPRSQLEYIQKMKMLLSFNPASRDYDTLKPEGYDIAVHPVLHKLTERFMDIDELFRNSATEAELRALPAISYGKDKDPGIFKIFVSVLGKFGPAFVNAWDERKLSTFTNTQDFFKYVREKNNADAALARTIHDREQYMKPQLKLEDIAAAVTARQVEEVDVFNEKQGVTPVSHSNKPTFFRPRSQTILKRIDSANGDTSDTRDQQQEASTSDDEDDDGYKYEAVQAELQYLLQVYQQPPDKPKVRSDPKTMPCFKHLYNKGSCELGRTCQYSHSDSVMVKYCADKLKLYQSLPWTQSPYVVNGKPVPKTT